MRDASYMVAFFGALILLAAAGAWWMIFRHPDKRPVGRGEPRAPESRRVKAAAIASVIAFGVCAVAAVLAVVGWFN